MKRLEKEKYFELYMAKEIRRREGSSPKIREARKVVEQRAKERYEKEKNEYDSKLRERQQKERKTGEKLRG